MLTNIVKGNPDLIVSTGNILNVIKCQKPTEELVTCLQATVNELNFVSEFAQINRSNDNLNEKIKEHERNSIKIGAKIFLNNNSVEYLNEAVTALLRILDVECLDNLILAYHPKATGKETGSPLMNGDLNSSEPKEGVLEWGGKSKQAVNDLKFLWKNLENHSNKKMICQLGISDLDTDTLSELYNTCEVHPTIAQINLTACCVVPPSLQEFCNKNDIQLLTHSDPEVMLTDEGLQSLGLVGYSPKWTIRYQVHVKCRGLLTAKGFIVGAKRP